RSHDFLAVQQCPISSPLIDRAIKAITAIGTGGHSGGELQELELFANQADDTLLVEAYCTSGIVQDDAVKLAEKLKASLQEIVGVTVFDATQASQPKYLDTPEIRIFHIRRRALTIVSAPAVFFRSTAS